MGVDFYSCHYCDETFPDCASDLVWCDCGAHFCSSSCGQSIKAENPDEPDTCRICRHEYIPDQRLLEFLLPKLSLTREEAEQLYRSEFIEHSASTA